MFRTRFSCLVIMFFAASPLSAEISYIDKTPPPDEVKTGLELFQRESKLFESIAYQAEFKNSLVSYAMVPKSHDPNQPGNGGATSIEQFPAPAVTTGVISVRRMPDRQWVRVEPLKVSAIQSSQSYGTVQVYSRIGKETRILNEKTNIAIIDLRKEQFPSQPTDMWMPEVFFTENQSEAWPAIYSGLAPEQIDRVLKELVIRREWVASAPSTSHSPATTEITTHEDFTLPEVQTLYGPLAVRRTIVFSKAYGWLPRRIEHLRNGRLYMSFDVEWGIGRIGGEVHIPQRITIRAYAPKTTKPEAADVLVKESIFNLRPSSVLIGADVEKLSYTLDIPESATVKRLTDPPLEQKSRQHSGMRLFETPLGIVSLMTIVAAALIAYPKAFRKTIRS